MHNPQELIKFLEQKGYDANCKICGTAKFIPTESNWLLVDREPQLQSGTPCIAVTCPNCGHIDLFSTGELTN